jgi:hypothetical protein
LKRLYYLARSLRSQTQLSRPYVQFLRPGQPAREAPARDTTAGRASIEDDKPARYGNRAERRLVGHKSVANKTAKSREKGVFLMSHHLDTPLAAQNGQLFIDDLYVFSAADSTVFIMDVNSNITGVHVKPGFHHEARYEFKVHFDGADFETLTYRVSFDEAGPDGRQAMKLHALTGKDAREDSATGELLLEGRTGEAASAGGVRLWAGRIADSFYVDLSLLAKVNGAVKDGSAVDLSGWRPENAKNNFTGTMVESIVLEVSHQHPQLKPGARIGVWCATKLATDAGGWRQINRGGYPMMWPIFWPDDGHFTNRCGQRDLRGPKGIRPNRGPRAVSRRPALRRGNARDIRLRHPQRPDAGGQRARSDDVPRCRNGYPLWAQGVGRQEPAC